MSVTTIRPTELEELRRQGSLVDLIDVRTPAEYREVHAEPARLVPLEALDPKAIMEARDLTGRTNAPLYTICRSGSRGRSAAEKFHAAGFPNVINVEGGTLAWERAGLPVIRGQKTVSLERQVRIAAGSLVVLGTALGAFVHPLFLGLAAFVGAGLVFAGITDTCGMAMILARMPWNQVDSEVPA
ncbi:rhodanese-like domain-containing protein [Singulisphaera sp. Ch08]|uniref:Rhodanese-like domain-containing protein n=1 Tax=Singulisphaera sp. Ch08 TaxID=3120278 RepID=A0AAU7CHT0_9BACT